MRWTTTMGEEVERRNEQEKMTMMGIMPVEQAVAGPLARTSTKSLELQQEEESMGTLLYERNRRHFSTTRLRNS